MLTRTGLRVNLINPHPREISIGDISWALAGKSRFNGHTLYTPRYTVAHHCCLAYDRSLELSDNWRHHMWALLHDAAEAYLPDVHSVLKDHLTGFRTLEKRFMTAIASRFGMGPEPGFIKEIDRKLLATERRDLMPEHGDRWPILDGYKPYIEKIDPWDQNESCIAFMARFASVTNSRGPVRNGSY